MTVNFSKTHEGQAFVPLNSGWTISEFYVVPKLKNASIFSVLR